MDFSILISSIQLAVAAMQLRFDHFKKPTNQGTDLDRDNFNNLGESIRVLEFALAETVAFLGQGNATEPNPRLAQLWQDASNSIRNIPGTAELADIAFEKNLYWRNPERYQDQDSVRIYRISLDNVLIQLRQLRSKYDNLHLKINANN